MSGGTVKYLTGVEIQVNGTKILTSPQKINLKMAGATGQENPSRVAEINLPEGGDPTLSDLSAIRTANGAAQPRFFIWGIDQEMVTSAGANAGLSADQTLAMPWLIKRTFTADYLVFKKNTNNQGLNYKAALYSSPVTSAYPAARLETSAELVSGADGLVGHYKWTFAAPRQFLRNTIYWLLLKRPAGADSGTFAGLAVYQQLLGIDMQTAYNGITGLNGYASAIGGTPYADAFPDPATPNMNGGTYSLFMVGVHITSIP